MELSKKTTILLSQQLHERLTWLAQLRGTSMGELIRTACRLQYGLHDVESRLEAVRELAKLDLPVADPQTMKEESTPSPEALLP